MKNTISTRDCGRSTRVNGRLFAAIGVVACAMALQVGCSDESSGSGGSGGSGGASSSNSSSGSGGAGGATSSSSAGGAGGAGGATSSSSAGGAGGGTSSSSASSSSASSSSASSSASGTGGGPTCIQLDLSEPNDTQGVAAPLGMATCKDTEVFTINGTLATANDVDWFSYDGKDGIGCLVNPTVDVIKSTTSSMQVCSYFFCTAGTAKVTCPTGTAGSTSPFGDPGCCGGSDYTANLDCEGTLDGSAQVYLQIKDPTSTELCADYNVNVHY